MNTFLCRTSARDEYRLRFKPRFEKSAGPVAAAMVALVFGAAPLPVTAQDSRAAQSSRAASTGAYSEARHVLNRLAYGPRPGEIEAVAQFGARKWIAVQLEPERIDASAVDAKLKQLRILTYDGPKLMQAYEADKAFQREQKAKRDKGDMKMTARAQSVADAARKAGFMPGMEAQTVGEMATGKLVRAVESPRQLQEVLVDFWSNHFNLDVNKGPVRTLRVADERDAIRPHVLGKFRALLGASAHSPAMLIYLDNARSTREYVVGAPGAGRQGRRRNLRQAALATGAAPAAAVPVAAPAAMMADEADGQMAAPAQAQAAQAQAGQTPAEAPQPPRKRGGLNENYARELMELHTLGVDGGYTQKDVQEVARCFTGWSTNREGQFQFRAFAHDDGEKTVLGTRIPAGGGIKDGETVLDILAAHPSTARFISRKLAMRLVNDNPPAALVERAARTFLKTGGDLREVTQTIALSPEFFDTANRRAKIKSPFEFAVSAVRAMNGQVWVPNPTVRRERPQLLREGRASLGRGNNDRGSTTLARAVALMGQPLFAYAAPTGYSEDSQTWVSTGGLIARLNFSLDLASGSVSNAAIDRARLFDRVDLNDSAAIIGRLNEYLLGGDMSPSTRATLEKQAGATPDANKLLALTLGSPEFQRR